MKKTIPLTETWKLKKERFLASPYRNAYNGEKQQKGDFEHGKNRKLYY